MFRVKNLRKFARASTYLGAALFLLFTIAIGYNKLGIKADTNFAPGYVVKDGTTFVVFNASKIVPKEEDRELIKNNPSTKDFLINDEFYLPVGMLPSQVDNIYYQNDKDKIVANANLKKIWGFIKTAFAKVQTEAINRNNNVSDATNAQISGDYISRKLSTSKPSYLTLNTYFIIDNYSKHLPNISDRNALKDLLASGDAKAQLGNTQIDTARDELTLYTRIYGTNDINSLNYQAWTALKKIYDAIKNNPNKGTHEQSDRSDAIVSSDAISTKLNEWKQNHSKSVYERIKEGDKEYFLVSNYSKWIKKDDLKQIQENTLFEGTPIRQFFVGSFIKLPVIINPTTHISASHTPLTNSIATKFDSIYYAIVQANLTPGQDNQDANQSIDNLEAFVNDTYVIRGCKSTENYKFGILGNAIVVCDPENKVNKRAVSNISKLITQIKQVTNTDSVITLDYTDGKFGSITLPQQIQEKDVIMYESTDSKAWSSVIDFYRFIMNNTRDDQAEIKLNVANSITTIEGVLKNPPVYLLDTDSSNGKQRLRVYRSFSACKNVKQGENHDIFIDEPFCIMFNPGTGANNKYFEPKEGSKAHALLKGVLAKARNETDKNTIEQFLDDYESQFTSSTGSGNVTLTAPKLFKQRVISNVPPVTVNGFQTYELEVPLRYKIDINESLTQRLASTGTNNKLGIAIYVNNGIQSDNRLIAQLEAKNDETVRWNVDSVNDSSLAPYVAIGQHKFAVMLFAYNSTQGLPAAGDTISADNIISLVGHDFTVVGPNGEREPSGVVGNPDSCTGAAISSVIAPNKLKAGNAASIFANVTQPRAPLIDGQQDKFAIYITKDAHPAGTDPATIQGPDDWVEKTSGNYTTGKVPQPPYVWQNSSTTPEQHFIMVKTYRGPNPYDSKMYCTGKKYKAITIDPTAPENNCRMVNGVKVCDGDDDSGGGVQGPSLPGDGSSIDNLPDLVDRIIEIFFATIGALAVLANVISGIMYLTAGGDSGKAEKAKKALVYSAIAIIIAVLAYVILKVAAGTINQIITGKK